MYVCVYIFLLLPSLTVLGEEVLWPELYCSQSRAHFRSQRAIVAVCQPDNCWWEESDTVRVVPSECEFAVLWFLMHHVNTKLTGMQYVHCRLE